MKNQYGVEVRECCASCMFKDLTKLAASRFCLMHHKSVKARGWCERWKMSEQLAAAGSAGGKVKKQAYLKYLLEIREEESLALQQGIRITHKSVDQIRKEIEEKNGSIYVEP